MSSAKGLADGYSPFEVGTGRVDVAAAVDRHRARHRFRCSSATTPGRTSPSDAAVTHDLTFTNDGDRGRHPRPRPDRDRRRVHAGRVHRHRAGRRQGHGPGHRRPAGRRPRPPRRLRRRHRRATGDPVTRTSVACSRRTSATTWTSRWSTATASPPPAGSPSTWPATDLGAWGEYVDGAKTLRMPPGDLLGDGLPRRPGRGRPTGPAWPCWSTRRPCSTSRPRSCSTRGTHACSRPRRRSAPRTASARSTSASPTAPAWSSAAPTPCRRVDDIYVSPTDADDAGLVHADHPLAQGRADAQPRHAAGVGQASTPSCSRAAPRHADRHGGDRLRRQRRGGRLRRASTPRARSRSSSAATRSRRRSAPRRPQAAGRGR